MRDTALSIWFQGFARSHYGFANDLADIAEFFDGHDRLMRHWRERSPLPIFTLDYEALIDAPETTLEALRGFIGLPPLPRLRHIRRPHGGCIGEPVASPPAAVQLVGCDEAVRSSRCRLTHTHGVLAQVQLLRHVLDGLAILDHLPHSLATQLGE
ncbi:sulfotransferase [Rhodanobacter lindaniclasticus]